MDKPSDKKLGRIGLVVENQEPATAEQSELVIYLTDALSRARSGDLLGVATVEIHSDGEYIPLMSGELGSFGEIHIQLAILNRTLEDAVSGLGEDDDD